MRVGIAQISSKLGNIQENLRKHASFIEEAKSKSVDLLVFPELSLTGYNLKDLYFELSKESTEALNYLSSTYKDIHMLVGFIYEPRIGLYYNSAAILGEGKVKQIYQKIYLPTYGLFEEGRYFTEVNQEYFYILKTVSVNGINVAAIICEDAWHPEPAELLARIGADLILIPASSPARNFYNLVNGKPPISLTWEAILKTRAVENTSYIVFANRVGPEDEEFFWGGSMIVSPEGEVVASAKVNEEDFITYDLDLTSIKRARRFSSFKKHVRDIHRRLLEL
ncbi:MAG: nitrilase-related carbon-nitrogen hydrolase [Thermoproteota archaeon]|nr:amidohydrolase [Candidatus Brockarchaeota archaeon]